MNAKTQAVEKQATKSRAIVTQPVAPTKTPIEKIFEDIRLDSRTEAGRYVTEIHAPDGGE